ncbi:MAG: hypothetical protein AAF705_15605, partial [Bacteroidota bacterium]
KYQNNMGKYQKYAVETLIDGKGDCSDTSVLLAGIYKAMGYSCIFIDVPQHLAVGITGNYYGTFWKYKGIEYFACETTSNSPIGTFDDNYKTATVIKVQNPNIAKKHHSTNDRVPDPDCRGCDY